MLVLKFDYESLAYDLCDALVSGVEESIQHFMSDAKTHLKSDDFETEKAIFDMAKKEITVTAIFYAKSILESYGRGSKMDITNEALADYMSLRSSSDGYVWNPDRQGFAISGRKEGWYTNIFGELVYSKGTLRGKNLENGFQKPLAPSFAIQNAERKLKQGTQENGYVMRILRRHADGFFENLNASKYFYNEEV